MKFNKWTLGLAAVGAVSMASAVRADEAKMSAVETALSNTTISGFVDIGVQANLGSQSAFSELPPYANNEYGDDNARNPIRDGFSLTRLTLLLIARWTTVLGLPAITLNSMLVLVQSAVCRWPI